MSAQVYDSLTNLTAGLTPARSKSMMSTYARPNITDQQLDEAYAASAIVQRVVDIPADDMTSKWREWQGDIDQITKIEEVERDFSIQDKVLQSIKRARVSGDAYMYFDNGDDPETPLDTNRSRPLRFVTALDRYDMADGEIEDDPMMPTFGMPRYYEVVTGDQMLRIDPSRIAHFTGRKRLDARRMGRVGESILPAMMNNLKSYDSVMANVSDMTWEAKIDVFGVMDLMRKVQDPDELNALMTRYNLMATQKGVNGMIVHDAKEEEYQQKQLSFATLPDIIDRFEVAVSGAAMVPRSRLFGVQTGGLGNAGESDEATYFGRISSKQNNELTPTIRNLDELIIRTALGSRPPELHYNWRPLSSPDAKEIAEIGGLIVKKWVDAVNAGIYSAEFATEPMTNELVEAGCGAGLEQALSDWSGAMHEGDLVDDVELGVELDDSV